MKQAMDHRCCSAVSRDDSIKVMRLEAIETALDMKILPAQKALDEAGRTAKSVPVQSEAHHKANDMLVTYAPMLENVRNRLCAFWYAASTSAPDTEREQEALEGIVKTASLEANNAVQRTALAYVVNNTPITNPLNEEAREKLAHVDPSFSRCPCRKRGSLGSMSL